MTLSYSKNKIHIYNWLAINPDRHREINKINQRRYDKWRAIQKVYLQILL